MPNCRIDLQNCEAKMIASELRRTARTFDPWPDVRVALFWFFFGAIVIAYMDYGDVHLCVGSCSNVAVPASLSN